MVRACRLVIDTGIHAFGWDRQRSIDYLRTHAGISEAFATAEVDRYIVVPGQALGYKLGELQIKALRAKARAALGDRFDLRRFHNAVIDDGALPLDVLEQQDRRLDCRRKKGASMSAGCRGSAFRDSLGHRSASSFSERRGAARIARPSGSNVP